MMGLAIACVVALLSVYCFDSLDIGSTIEAVGGTQPDNLLTVLEGKFLVD